MGCCVSVMVLAGAELFGAGFRLPDQDAFATARGEAFVATADNPSAIYYNPAGITQLEGHNFRAGVYTIGLMPTYTSPSGGSYDNEDVWHAVPSIFYAYTPKKLPLSFGLGVYSPYGLGVEWPQDTGFRSVVMEGSMSYMTLNPVVAWKIIPSLSVAAGPTFNYGKLDLRQGLLPVPGKDYFQFEGDGTDVGFNLGVRWQPIEQLAFGVSYRSQTTLDFDGNTTMFPGATMFPGYGYMAASAQVPYPQNLIMGVSYRPTPDWNFEFNADYTDWSRLDSVTVQQSLAVPPLLMYWDPCFYYEFGATRYLKNGWRVSAGYIFNENAMPTKTYSPLIADMDRHFFSLGVGHQGKHWSFDVAYQFGWGPTRTVEGSTPSMFTGQSPDGDYEFVSHAVAVTVGLKF